MFGLIRNLVSRTVRRRKISQKVVPDNSVESEAVVIRISADPNIDKNSLLHDLKRFTSNLSYRFINVSQSRLLIDAITTEADKQNVYTILSCYEDISWYTVHTLNEPVDSNYFKARRNK